MSSSPQSVVNQAVNAFISSFNNPFLEQFHLVEFFDTASCIIFPTITHLNSLSPHQLRNLHTIDLAWFPIRPSYQAVVNEISIDWSGLASCQSLQTLTLGGLRYFGGRIMLSSIFDMVPSSLTSLTIDLLVLAPCLVQIKERLSSPAFLPYLRELNERKNASIDHGSLVDVMSTIMTATGKMRPIQNLLLHAHTSIPNLDWCVNVQEATLHIDEPAFAQFVSQPSTVLPGLKKLNMLGLNDVSDLSPAILFASERPVTDLLLMYNGLGQVPCSCLSDEALRKFSMMSNLTTMYCASNARKFDLFGNNLSGILPVGCWPNLKVVEFGGCLSNEFNFLCFIKAAPQLLLATIKRSSFSLALQLPAIAHYCSLIQYLFERCQDATIIEPENVVDLACLSSAFTSFPLSNTSFQTLFQVELKSYLHDDALHFLCSQLKYAPRLISLKTHESIDVVCRALYNDDEDDDDDDKDDEQDWSIIYDIFLLRSYFLCRLPHVQFCHTPLNKVEFLLGDYVEPGRFFTKVGSRHTFRLMTDQPSADGRQLCCEALYSQLSDHAQAVCERWDDGDYTVKL